MKMQLEMPEEFSQEINKSIQKVYKAAIQEAQRNVGINREFITLEETCDLMQISRNTLSSWFEQGLEKYKIDRKYYVKKSDLNRFVEKHQV